MDAFLEAINNIDKIDIDAELVDTFKQSMQDFSAFFSQHPEIKINFDKLFKEKLYNNLRIKLQPEEVPEYAVACYNTGPNAIFFKEKKDIPTHFNKHTFIHEFIHFIIHNTYNNQENYNKFMLRAKAENKTVDDYNSPEDNRLKTTFYYHDVPTWLDEMMTEFWARKICGVEYMASYIFLERTIDFFEEYITTLTPDTFFNGEIKDFVNKYGFGSVHQFLSVLVRADKLSLKDKIENSSAIADFLLYSYANKLTSSDINLDDFLYQIFNTYKFLNNVNPNTFLECQKDITKQFITEKTGLELKDLDNLDYYLEYYNFLNKIFHTHHIICDKSYLIEFENETLMIAFSSEQPETIFLQGGSLKKLFTHTARTSANIETNKGGISYSNFPSFFKNTTVINFNGLSLNIDPKKQTFKNWDSLKSSLSKMVILEGSILDIPNKIKINLIKKQKEKQCDQFLEKNRSLRYKQGTPEYDKALSMINTIAKEWSTSLSIHKSAKLTTSNDENSAIWFHPIYNYLEKLPVAITLDSINKEMMPAILSKTNCGFGGQFVITGTSPDNQEIALANILNTNDSNSININLTQILPYMSESMKSELKNNTPQNSTVMSKIAQM